MGLEIHDTLHSRQSALPLSYQGSSAGWAQVKVFFLVIERLPKKKLSSGTLDQQPLWGMHSENTLPVLGSGLVPTNSKKKSKLLQSTCWQNKKGDPRGVVALSA